MAQPSDNVWVGDLPAGMDQETLTAVFEPYGAIVECKILAGKGGSVAAMIRFGSIDVASWVVENLANNIPEGLESPIQCRFANSPANKGGAKGASPYGATKGGAAKGGFAAQAPSDNIWVGDLPIGTEKNDLATIFESYGEIVDCKVLQGREGAKVGAMIRFASVDMAQWVVENLNGNIPEGLTEPIIARFANSSSSAKGAAKDFGGKAGVWPVASAPWGGAPWGGGGKSGMGIVLGKGAKGMGMDFGKGQKGKGGGKGSAPESFKGLFKSVKGSGILGGGTTPDDCAVYVSNLPADTTDFDLYRLFSPFGAIPPTGVKAMMNPDGSCKGIGFVDFSDPSAAQTAVMALEQHTLPDGTAINVTLKRASKGGGKGSKKN